MTNAETRNAADGKPVLHLVCNAHLDPIWMWDWQEGCLEALSTFRHAADYLDLYPDLVFNHNESLLYEWVERHDPELFARIQSLVRQGRWNIIGGWFLQPDCNMSSGETFVRLALSGRRFFLEKFGVAPTVACNFDAFGHNGSLPQILRGMGFEMYVHCRPNASELQLPAFFYRWQGVDGSSVYAYRSPTGSYESEEGGVGKRIESIIEKTSSLGVDQMLLWGVGDHGGGPTRADLKIIAEWMQRPGLPFVLRHSTPQAFLAAAKVQCPEPPVHAGDLQGCGTGCYTADAEGKRLHASLEALLQKAERRAAASSFDAGAPLPEAHLAAAWRGHLFNTFHDILPGSATEPGIESARRVHGHALHEAELALHASHAAVIRHEARGEDIPLFVFNPHPYPLRAPVVAEFMHGWRPNANPEAKPFCNLRVETLDGELVQAQSEKSHCNWFGLDWRRRLVFMADVPAGGWRRYRVIKEPARPLNQGAVDAVVDMERTVILENAHFALEVSKADGLARRLFDKRAGRQVARGLAFVPLAVNDPGGAWGTGFSAYRDVAGAFRFIDDEETGRLLQGAPSRSHAINIVERGPIRTIAESLLRWGRSSVLMRYVLWHDKPCLDVEMRVHWDERRRMLKLAVPLDLPVTGAVAGIPFGAINRPVDGQEHVFNGWVASLCAGGHAVAFLTGSQHGFDMTPEELRLSLLRSVVPSHWTGAPPGPRAYPFLDLGQRDFVLRVISGPSRDILACASLECDLLRMPLDAIAAIPSTQTRAAPRVAAPGPLVLSDTRIALAAIKRAQTGDAWVVRLYNTTAAAAPCVIRFLDYSPIEAPFGPYQVKTWLAKDGRLVPCDLQEQPLHSGLAPAS